MTHLHPDTDFLIDYAAGSLADAHALCVAAHLEHCPKCASEVENLTSVGGVIFNTQTSVDSAAQDSSHERQNDNALIDDALIDDALIEQTIGKAVDAAHQDAGRSSNQRTTPEALPVAFRALAPDGIENLNWKSFGKNLSVADIQKIDDKREVALHRLEPGGAVAHHDHRGREITVVLTGSFSDRNGQYYPGDFIVKEPGEQHRPTASENTPCVCLSVTEAPVRFTGMLTRLLNPLVAYRHPR